MEIQPSAADFASIPKVWRPRASPSGEKVAFFWNSGGRFELYFYDLNCGGHCQVTDGELHRSPNAPAVWAPDGTALYVQTGDHGYDLGSIYRVDVDGGVEHVTTPGGGWGILWDVSQDGEWLLYAHAPNELDGGEQRVYRYHLPSDRREPISGPEEGVKTRGVRFSPSSDRVCYTANASSDPANEDPYIATVDGSERRRLPISDEGESVQSRAWHPDGNRLLVQAESRAGVVDLETDDVAWVSDGKPVAFLDRTTIILTNPNRLYDLDTGATQDIEIDSSVGDELAADGVRLDSSRLLFTRSTERRPAELYVYDRTTGDERRLVIAEFGSVDSDSLVTATDVSYESTDDRAVEALLYRPSETNPENPLPVIVEAHGFPGEESRGFKPKVQFFVSRGHAVFQPNYRGAENRDAGFTDSIEGDWGGAEQEDVAAAAGWLTEQEWADDDRMVIYGHSFGGFTAYTQMVRYPETWTAGVASGGITDLHLLDGTKGGDELLRAQMGDPGEDAALWRDRSPITHVDKMERPLLILHGTNDPTTPIWLAQAFKGALEAVRGWTEGEEFEYKELETGEHGNLDNSTKVRRWELLLDFLERHL